MDSRAALSTNMKYKFPKYGAGRGRVGGEEGGTGGIPRGTANPSKWREKLGYDVLWSTLA